MQEILQKELSVSELSQILKNTVETIFDKVRIKGEISQPKLASSGHLYLRLKDNDAVIDAICWKGSLLKLKVKPEEGLEVICEGKLTTYPGRSSYQIIIEKMEVSGEGALLKLLEERKKKLAAEGLFAPERKRKLPFLPENIGVITSPTGAVIRDILHRLHARFPRNVLLWPVAVQGEGAAEQIVRAIEGFNALTADSKIKRPDLLIVARGGGSLEDLMAFNEENVVRAVANSKIPVISAVGHETDTTLIDYASDLRAPTPTAAAEMAVPVREELLMMVLDKNKRFNNSLANLLLLKTQELQSLAKSILDPKYMLNTLIQNFDDKAERLGMSFANFVGRRSESFARSKDVFGKLIEHQVVLISQNLGNLAIRLENLSYKKVLNRGYAIVMDKSNKVISGAKEAALHRTLKITFADGECEVIQPPMQEKLL
mgnify:CR=1 FL=1